ncbi:MAG: N-acetylmuramoyl-L-alanine amidase [Acidimicrobiales bacterium]|nr:N-acetylmuramoyl-L-alanine amidase [Acidimicrobiales bacterium]
MTDPAAGSPLLGPLADTVVRRRDWGAPARSDWPPEVAPVRALVIHHTGTRNDDPDPLAMVARVRGYHADERGWGDIGYSFLVLEDGRIVEGREGSADATAPCGVVAGHAYGHNVGTLGIAVAGRFHDAEPTDAAWTSLIALGAAIATACDLDAEGGPVVLDNGARLDHVIGGHRDAGLTTCPGEGLAARLPDLRRSIARACATR